MGGRDNFPLGKIFQEFLGGRKIFPSLFLVNFDVFLVDFDAKIQTEGENMPKIQNGGEKEGGQTPEWGGTNFPEFFFKGGGETQITFPPPFLDPCACMLFDSPWKVLDPKRIQEAFIGHLKGPMVTYELPK